MSVSKFFEDVNTLRGIPKESTKLKPPQVFIISQQLFRLIQHIYFELIYQDGRKFSLFTNITHLDCTIITSTTNELWASSGYLTWINKCCVTFQLFDPLPNFNIPECNSFVSGCCDQWAAIFTSMCYLLVLFLSLLNLYRNSGTCISNVLQNILISKKDLKFKHLFMNNKI